MREELDELSDELLTAAGWRDSSLFTSMSAMTLYISFLVQSVTAAGSLPEIGVGVPHLHGQRQILVIILMKRVRLTLPSSSGTWPERAKEPTRLDILIGLDGFSPTVETTNGVLSKVKLICS